MSATNALCSINTNGATSTPHSHLPLNLPPCGDPAADPTNDNANSKSPRSTTTPTVPRTQMVAPTKRPRTVAGVNPSLTTRLWADAGAPPNPSATNHPAACALCGTNASRTTPASKALGSGWSDYTALRRPDSDRICEACQWIMTGIPPHTWRMWSVLYTADHEAAASDERAPHHGPHSLLTNRANPRPIADALLNPPTGTWAVTIATSGQKHIIPMAGLNNSQERWQVRFEATTITATPTQLADLLTPLAHLRAAGFTADEIQTGRISSQRLTVDAIATWRNHYQHVRPHRTAPLTDLALWLLTKETIHDHTH